MLAPGVDILKDYEPTTEKKLPHPLSRAVIIRVTH
jgi:hypothetical protein